MGTERDKKDLTFVDRCLKQIFAKSKSREVFLADDWLRALLAFGLAALLLGLLLLLPRFSGLGGQSRFES